MRICTVIWCFEITITILLFAEMYYTLLTALLQFQDYFGLYKKTIIAYAFLPDDEEGIFVCFTGI